MVDPLDLFKAQTTVSIKYIERTYYAIINENTASVEIADETGHAIINGEITLFIIGMNRKNQVLHPEAQAAVIIG